MPLDPSCYAMVCERPLNDLWSECQSFGSNCHLSIQPRKISRGILADSGAQFRPKSIKKDAVVTAEECKTQLQLEGKRLQSVQEGSNGKQSQVLEEQMSLLSTRASDKKISTSEAHDMSDGATKAKITFSADHANLKPGVEGNARSQSKPGKVNSGSKDANAKVTNKLSFAPGQPIMPDDNLDKTEIRGSETLRVSLWKILETVSSPHKQHPSNCNLKNKDTESDCFRKNKEEVSPVLKSTRRSDMHLSDCNLKNEVKESDYFRKSNEVNPVLKSMQRSDTIESDYDCHNHGLRRSLGLKRASSKVERKRKTEPSLYNDKHKRLKKAYPPSEVFTAGLSVRNTGDSPILQQKGERQGSVSEKCKMLFNELENQGENLQANSRNQSFINTRKDNDGFSWKNSKFIKPKKLGVENGYVQCPLGNISEHPRRVDGSPKVQENVDCPKGLGHSSRNNTIAHESDVESPTFKRQTPTKSPTCSQPFEMKTSNKGLSYGSPFKHISSLRCGGLDDHGHQDKSRIKGNKFIKPKNLGVEKGYVQCPLGNTSEHPRRVDDSPKVQENVDCPNGLGHSSKNNTIAQESDVESPTFKLHTPTKSPTCSQPCEMKTPNKGVSYDHGGLDDHGHQDKSGIKGIKSFKRLLASRQNDYLADSQMNISKHDAEDLQGTVGKFRKPVVVEKSAKGIRDVMIEHSDSEASEEERISEASEEERKSEASEEDLNTQGCVESESLSSENILPAKGAFGLDLQNKQFYQGGFGVTGFCTNLASEKGTSKRHLGSADQQDELSRAVALFSSALEGVKRKMKSVARKRSAEILTSVSDRIHLQLENAESHIQADVRKLGSFSKSKKKCLEMRCEELQGELNVMHRNFKEEVNRHLQKCKSTVEGLDAQELELKATVEKQRASHRKLILEAEKAIEADLIDAQKRISVIQNLARGKMLELKKLVAELLKEGIIS